MLCELWLSVNIGKSNQIFCIHSINSIQLMVIKFFIKHSGLKCRKSLGRRGWLSNCRWYCIHPSRPRGTWGETICHQRWLRLWNSHLPTYRNLPLEGRRHQLRKRSKHLGTSNQCLDQTRRQMQRCSSCHSFCTGHWPDLRNAERFPLQTPADLHRRSSPSKLSQGESILTKHYQFDKHQVSTKRIHQFHRDR